ncbi:PepSY domain-containing protein [Priestia taiwanensis]|uniref:Peptidase M4 n=1 Tax=Priestia taiwanensis TaxID=1347902 RepID=A0A917AVT5_9BACI|nr:PepSY domain-containing protein [Priestia taiwanensis]MBM7363389.1 putative small secreted protein [Priestia taiwanensis]GGE77564.1 peptidase M4 [Priestia taiwanensis]
MSWKKVLIGVGIGVGAGVGANMLVQKKLEKKYVKPEDALSTVKEAFKRKGEISGSWIHMIPESYDRFGLEYEVYRGGITAKEEEGSIRYEFLVDATTGTVLDVSPLKDAVTV